MKIWWLAPLMLSVASGFSSITHANPKDKIIYIVRHGEKIDGNVGLGELGGEGPQVTLTHERPWNRLWRLMKLLNCYPQIVNCSTAIPRNIHSRYGLETLRVPPASRGIL